MRGGGRREGPRGCLWDGGREVKSGFEPKVKKEKRIRGCDGVGAGGEERLGGRGR